MSNDKSGTKLQAYLGQCIDPYRNQRLLQATRHLLALRHDEGEPRDDLAEYNKLVAESIGNAGSEWGHYDPFRPSIREYSRMNLIQNNLRILTAQTRAIDVAPQWVNTADDIVARARAEWWKWRSHGMDGLGGWKTDFDNAFSDFAALGEGYLRAGLTKGEKGNAVTVTHYHPLNIMLDPYAKYSNESRWVCFSTVYGREEAAERFPKFDFDAHVSAQYQRTGMTVDGVRIIEYFARKSVDSDMPSYCAMAGYLSGEVIDEDDNPFGDVLPYQSFLGFIPSGSDMPIGMVASCLYVQSELTRIDDDYRKKSERENLLGLPPELFNKDDLAAYADGKRPEFLRLDAQYLNKTDDPARHIITVPRNGENVDQKQRRQELFGMMQMLSGVSSLDMGQISGNDATATEIAQVAARGQSQVSFYSREFARGVQELAVKAAKIAKKFDTDPFCVNMDGVPIWYNSGDRRLTSQTLFDGPLNVVIGDEDLIMTDVNSKRMKEGQKWLQIFGVSQSPEAWRQYLLSQGIKNPEDFMPPSMGPGGPGGPGPGGPGPQGPMG